MTPQQEYALRRHLGTVQAVRDGSYDPCEEADLPIITTWVWGGSVYYNDAETHKDITADVERVFAGMKSLVRFLGG